MSIYDSINVKTYLNPRGTITMVGGSLMRPEVLDAMVEASRNYVSIPELQQKVGERIAAMTHNEAAFISNGAASGMVLAAAAIIAGLDQERRMNLPKSDGKNEVLVATATMPRYGHAITVGGGKIVSYGPTERGIPLKVEDLENAITDKTAAVFYFHNDDLIKAGLCPAFEELAAVANAHNIPFVVDAAAQFPPYENLWRFTKGGAAIAIFSGGKGLRGPQSTGLMVGRKDIIDVVATYACPNVGVGRPMKTGKEEIVGLYTAIKLALEEDEQELMAKWEARVDAAIAILGKVPGLQLTRIPTTDVGKPFSHLDVVLAPKMFNITTEEMCSLLEDHDPAVHVGQGKVISLSPQVLADGEMEIIANIIAEVALAHRV